VSYRIGEGRMVVIYPTNTIPPVIAFYTDTFVEQPSFDSLDACEDRWVDKLNEQIKFQSMIPSVL